MNLFSGGKMTIFAKVIADSISPHRKRITSLQLRYPRWIHSEFLTHRVFSRNASSSRAIPVEKLIEDIIADTAMPIHWGKNQPGMQADEECDALIDIGPTMNLAHPHTVTTETAWSHARDMAIANARAFHKAGYHKQIVNRLLEPFSHINVICTATEWDNFFELRLHKDAQPEIRELARCMKESIDNSTPKKLDFGDWHLPYVMEGESQFKNELLKISVARCARVSYMTHDGKVPNIEQDLKLYERLVGSVPLHASPAEHQARPITGDDALRLRKNFRGWIPYRSILEL
jgi:hypothetical protein